MSRLDRALSRLAERGDPIGSDLLLERLERQLTGEAAPKVVALETRREPMSVTTERPVEKSPKERTRRRNLALALAAAVIVAAVGVSAWLVTDESSEVASSDPAAVLADYQEARNSGDVDAVMAFFAEDAVYENHPLVGDGVVNGVLEIRGLEARIPGIQGSTGGIEFTDIVVSGNTVTFNHKFLNEEGDCFGRVDAVVTVEDNKITRYFGGAVDPSQCG